MAADKILYYTAAMALVTYLIRMLPLALIRRRISSPLARSFLHYVPYAVLAAMIIPDMLYATSSIWSAASALAIGIILSLRGQKLIVVALAACVTVLVVEGVLRALGAI